MIVETRLSPNHDARAPGAPVDMLDPPLHRHGRRGGGARPAVRSRGKGGGALVRASRRRVVRMIDETRRAWHAGVSLWAGERDINSRSVGIEIHNPGHDFGYPDFPNGQIEAVIALCGAILRRHPIPPHRVLAHSDVAPGRKIDPGERFPWPRLYAAGIGHWVAPLAPTGGPALRPGDAGEEVRVLRGRLAVYGYGLAAGDAYDEATATVVAAFQRHFRPRRIDGIADRSTRETLARLCAARDALPGHSSGK
jgi:N-acetylmuramoyl-L-alanine amidase